jgi:CheY-like chemotaxis protein
VLLVDGDPKVLRLVEATLRGRDYDVRKAERLGEGMESIRDQVPDVVVLDPRLPDGDGGTLVRQLRAAPRGTTVPVLLLAQRGAPGARHAGTGPESLLRKPFSLDEFLRRVEELMAPPGDPEEEPPWTQEQGPGSFSDLLSRLSLERATGRLDVVVAGAAGPAELFLRDGAIVAARWGLLEGVPAVIQLLTRPGGQWRLIEGPGETGSLSVSTLRLLMEAHRLQDAAVARRIDPFEPAAAAAWSATLVAAIRSEAGLLTKAAPVPPSPRPATASGHPAEPTEVQSLELDPIQEDPDSEETQAVPSLEGPAATDDEPWPAEADEEQGEWLASARTGVEPPVGDLEGDEDPPSGSEPLTDPRLALLLEADKLLTDSSADIASPGEEGDGDDADGVEAAEAGGDQDNGVGLRTEDFAPDILDDGEDAAIAAPADEDGEEDDAIDLGDELVADEDGEGEGAAPVLDETGVQVVEDTLYQVPVLDPEPGDARPDVMALYERLRAVAIAEAGAAEVQLSTRGGRVVASTVRDEERRGALAGFASQAILLASTDHHGTRFATLDAGNQHVVVVEIDGRRVFATLFDRKPDPLTLLDSLRPTLRGRNRP